MAHPKAGKPKEAPLVKYLAAILHAPGFDLERRLFPELELRFGRIDYRGDSHPFTVTDYYEEEMGPGLGRVIVSFEPLRPATDIVAAKAAAARIEERLSQHGSRRVNVDIGYLDYFKVVLASFKEGPQKIYLGEGVYADPVLLYRDGAYRPLEWSFPDFKAGAYKADLMAARALYKKARRDGDEQFS